MKYLKDRQKEIKSIDEAIIEVVSGSENALAKYLKEHGHDLREWRDYITRYCMYMHFRHNEKNCIFYDPTFKACLHTSCFGLKEVIEKHNTLHCMNNIVSGARSYITRMSGASETVKTLYSGVDDRLLAILDDMDKWMHTHYIMNNLILPEHKCIHVKEEDKDEVSQT